MDTPISIRQSVVDGFDTIQLSTGAVSLAILPALGAKISSLRDLRTGREWLWRNPRMPYRPTRPGASYVQEADTGGWDECFPTVAPCEYPLAPYTGVPLQDHGELWSQPAALQLSQSGSTLELGCSWQGASIPFVFERRIILKSGSAVARFEYRATNRGDLPLAFIWCAHPLFAIAPGMEVLLPRSARFNCWSSLPAGVLRQRTGLVYPPEVEIPGPSGKRVVPLASLPDVSTGVALKLWSDPLEEGWAALRSGTEQVRMHWDVNLLPQVALWMNLGGWAGDGGEPYYNLGLEPCIGAQDSLADAVMVYERFATIPPSEGVEWWLELTLD